MNVGLNSFEEKVLCDERLSVEVQRNGNDDCARVTMIKGLPLSGSLRVGQYLLGASLGSAKISFNKLPLALVQKELGRLKSIRKHYSLIVTDYIETGEPDAEIERINSPLHRTPEKSHHYSLNPQERTPPPSFKLPKSDSSPSSRMEVASKERWSDKSAKEQEQEPAPSSGASSIINGDASKLTSMLQFNDVSKIQASLERLRGQRVMMERLKSESAKKDVRIQGLTKQLQSLRTDLSSALDQVHENSRVHANLQVAEEKISIMETKLAEKDEEIERVKNVSVGNADFLKTSLDQEKKNRESDRVEQESIRETLMEELEVIRVEKQMETQTKQQLQVDITLLRKQLDEATSTIEDIKCREAEKYSVLQRNFQSLQLERDALFDKVRTLEMENESRSDALKCTTEALTSAEQRANLLNATIQELEENTVQLRKELLDSERRFSSKMTESKEQNSCLDNLLTEKSNEIALLEKKLTVFKDRFNNELADHKDTRSAYIRKSQELDNMVQSMKRLSEQHSTLQVRLGQANATVDGLHKEMLRERERSSKLSLQLESEKSASREWATSRLELLNQFCEEEERFRRL
uniref:Uncharacterized protein n=1 Tax=Mucochytrium quahogii TaxID=96639 RepID=A0A7S2RFG3_9STRA|mmetsp:Transcript_606/g.776  ORF Transcript_606/g.776 Transcript_606/m.776 type:complete len:581 (-) Transcript_606:30-1772(-)